MGTSKTYLIAAIFFIIVIISITPIIIFSVDNNNLKHELQYYKDSVIMQEETIFKLTTDIMMYNIEVENYKDSINSLINELDSVNEELQINKIKIERIREYNRIAAQGNNIKFLRGWINRVIN